LSFLILVLALVWLPGCVASSGAATARKELAAFQLQVLDDYIAFERAQEPSEENGYDWQQYYAHLFDPARNPRALAVGWLEEFEAQHRGTQVGFDALNTALGYLCYLDYSQGLAHEKAAAYYGLLLEHYMPFESLGNVCYYGCLYQDPEDFLATMDLFIARSPHRTVRAKAIAAKLHAFQRALRFDQQLECAEVLLETYPDVMYQNIPCGELAQKSLVHHCTPERLQIGESAPEITGYDVVGSPIALSDYRGKVVVMTFFGFW